MKTDRIYILNEEGRGVGMNRFFNKANINSSNISQSINGNRATVNGKTIDLPSGNISIVNGRVTVNGKEVDMSSTDLKSNEGIINVTIKGNVSRITTKGSVSVTGDMMGDIDCGGSSYVEGDVNGDIDCGGSCSVGGGHKGSIDAGGSVSIR